MQYSFGRRRLFLGILLGAALLPAPVLAQTIISKKLSGIVQESDQIFVGECTQKEFLVRNGTIITRYHLRPSEMIKGTMTAAQQGNIIVEEPGGESPYPSVPIAAMVPSTARISQGEEVLLFTTKPKLNPKLEKSRKERATRRRAKSVSAQPTYDENAYRIVGLNQGYYSVVTNPQSKMKMVMHGGSPEMTRVKNAQTARHTTATQTRVNQFLANTMQKKLAERNQQKLSGKEPGDKIQSFALLEDVKLQIAQAMQKSQ